MVSSINTNTNIIANMYKILDGKLIASQIKKEISTQVEELKKAGKRPPHISIIIIGDDSVSHVYVNAKINACKEVGFDFTLMHLTNSIQEAKLIKYIEQLNLDDDIDGFIVQLPIPLHISIERITKTILPQKDVDGFTNENFGSIVSKNTLILPATAFGVMELIKRYNIQTKGKHAVVVGASRLAGAPISSILTQHGLATVTTCHKYTENIQKYTQDADILVVAAGVPHLINEDMIKEQAIVIDVGINRIEDLSKKQGYRLIGDVNFEKVAPKCSYISPVPGGVGPMTIVSLLLNTLNTYTKKYTNTLHLLN